MKTPGLSPSGLGPGTPSSTLIVTPELNPSPPPLFQAEGQGARVLDDLNLELNLPQFPSEGQETHGLNFNYLSPSYGAPYAGRHTTQAPSGAQYDDYFTSETLVGGPSPATDDPEFSPCDHVAVDAELATVPSTLNGAQRLTDSPWPVKQSQRGTDEHRNLTGMPPAFHALAAKHDTRLTGGAGGSGSGSLVPTGSFKATGASAAHWAAVEKRRKRDRRHQCDHCPDRFTSKQNLTNHKNSHFLLKPYKCEYCDKDYRHSRSLNRHLKKAHSIPTDRRRRRDG
ncbi:hypothetical protein P691DRAFT_502140 [Macrolepiota fuliginosa MF-IS2]|uniref:C2H2-type domain-containing protein n=1 Tax=Macrolepiota fuliginosa MF-IS2 TaxID=1400762 RepID=A0A9P5XHW5_9AGAR|nr:hypothetical protein P691DRAFT_502140 [Macrolepiota fuliginosa MF-IS2]